MRLRDPVRKLGRECLVQEPRDLLLVRKLNEPESKSVDNSTPMSRYDRTNLVASSDRARRYTPGIDGRLAIMVRSLRARGLEARRDVRPCAVVERLFLAPEKVCVGVLVEVGRYLGRKVACKQGCKGRCWRKKGRTMS